jgi:hypothetical protein
VSNREYSLPLLEFEDALNRLTTWLRDQLDRAQRHTPTGDVLQFSINAVVQEVLQQVEREDREERPFQGMTYIRQSLGTNSGPFHDACWELCRRGVLRPAITYPHSQEPRFTGFEFAVTTYGGKWLRGLSGYECSPADYGRFSGLLARHAERLGSGYAARAQESLVCYRAQAYLASCAMCGAAAESILLALAIRRTDDEERVLREYQGVTGRTRIERLLIAQQNSHIQTELVSFTQLLKYWRDAASHGASTTIDEEEAFTSLILLLRFARFADERWDVITNPA